MALIPGLSDHEIPQIRFSCNPPKKKPTKRKVLLWKRANIEAIKVETKKFVSYFLKTHDMQTPVDNMWNCIKTSLLAIQEDNVPTKLTTSKNNKPWINSETKRILRKKKKWFKKAKSSQSEAIREKYREVKRAAQKQCRRAHSEFINQIIDDESRGSKRLWSYVKSKNTEHVGIAELKDHNNKLTQEPKEKANILNKQFSSVFSDPSAVVDGKLIENKAETMEKIIISEKGVHALLQNLKENKATGPDEISAKFLKTFADELTPLYTFLFQASLDQGQVPMDWKSAYITPIYKKGDKTSAENYRPVSLTSISCKLLEHVICTNIMKHMELHGLLTDVQHGFRKSRSCETQLITACNDFANTINEGGQTDAILLDFSKAFDKVHHRSLLKKIDHLGITDKLLQWIDSFLSCRTQRVVVENEMSSPLPVLSGVPQGTVLGPLLFLIYINDMPSRISDGSRIRLFADDSLLYREIKDSEDSAILQEDLNNLQAWEKEWKMEFHPKKCQLIQITKKKKVAKCEYYIHNEKLETTSKAEYLGVTLDSKLSWQPHIDKVCKKANSKLGFLRRNLQSCPKHIREKCYKVFVRPILEYSASVWDPKGKERVEQVEKVQKRACRFVCDDHRRTQSVSGMRESLNWQTLKKRRALQKVKMFYKARQGLATLPIDNLPMNKRKANSYLVPYSRVNAHLDSFIPSTIRLWNSIPENVRNSTTIAEFEEGLDACIF